MYCISFSTLFYSKFCKPWIISEQNSRRELTSLAARIVYANNCFKCSSRTRVGGLNRKVLSDKDDALSRIRYLRRIKELREAGYTNLPRHSEMLARRHYLTEDTLFFIRGIIEYSISYVFNKIFRQKSFHL